MTLRQVAGTDSPLYGIEVWGGISGSASTSVSTVVVRRSD
jgi:hypothetical protein